MSKTNRPGLILHLKSRVLYPYMQLHYATSSALDVVPCNRCLIDVTFAVLLNLVESKFLLATLVFILVMDFPKLFDLDFNVNNICRICLCEVKVKDAMGLFSEDKESKEIINKLHLCFQVSITYKSFLPCIICKSCINEVNIADNLRLKCSTFEERFAAHCKQISEQNSALEHTEELVVKALKEPSKDVETELVVDIEPDCELNADDINEGRESEAINKEARSKRKSIVTSTANSRLESYTCNTCDRSFKKKDTLLKHNVTMHLNRKHVGRVTGYGATRRYHCPKCLYSTPYSQTLVAHVRRHTGEKPYQCECGKRFTDLSTFNTHSRIHSNTTYYTCSTCGKQFKIAKALRQHLRSHETAQFPCEVCPKVLKSRQTLQDHTRRHYDVRNFNCEDCGDTFVTSSELIHHKVKHKLEKNLECHLCGYKTRRRRNLIIHLKRHANDRPYKCDLCTASFYTRPDVRRHQRVHTREKAFQCPSCPKGFTRKSALTKHMQTSHIRDNKCCDYKNRESNNIKEETTDVKLNENHVIEIQPLSSSIL